MAADRTRRTIYLGSCTCSLITRVPAHAPFQFRIYTGLLSSMPVYRKPRAKERGLDHPDIGYANDGSDDEGDHDMPRARHTVTVQDTLEQIAQPGKQLEPDHFDESSAHKQLLCAFTDDIENGTKIFLGAYMRHSDLIWWVKSIHCAS